MPLCFAAFQYPLAVLWVSSASVDQWNPSLLPFKPNANSRSASVNMYWFLQSYEVCAALPPAGPIGSQNVVVWAQQVPQSV